MKPIDFKDRNVIYAEKQPEYTSIPALKIDSDNGEVVSCWKLSFRERIKILFTGTIWMSIATFNKPLSPSYLSVNKDDVYIINND
jgi:hypothetical protein